MSSLDKQNAGASAVILLEHVANHGAEASHLFEMNSEYENLEVMTTLPVYGCCLVNHEFLLKKIARLSPGEGPKFDHLLFLDDIALVIYCIPLIILKLFPNMPISYRPYLSAMLYTSLLCSMFIQRQIGRKL